MFHSGHEMSLVITTSGDGAGGKVRQSEKRGVRTRAAASFQTAVENEVTFQTPDGVELRARLARLARHALTFEAENLAAGLRTSEVLANFKVTSGNRVVYFGRAVVSSVVHAGGSLICEVKLDDLGSDTAFFLPPAESHSNIEEAYSSFLAE
jgi:hypothetical protein